MTSKQNNKKTTLKQVDHLFTQNKQTCKQPGRQLKKQQVA